MPNIFATKAWRPIRHKKQFVACWRKHRIALPIGRVDRRSNADGAAPSVADAQCVIDVATAYAVFAIASHKKHVSSIGRKTLRTFVLVGVHRRGQRSCYLPCVVIGVPTAPIEVFLIIIRCFIDQHGGRNHASVGRDARKIVVETCIDGLQIDRIEWHRMFVQFQRRAETCQHLHFLTHVTAVSNRFGLLDGLAVTARQIMNLGYHGLCFAVARKFGLVYFG